MHLHVFGMIYCDIKIDIIMYKFKSSHLGGMNNYQIIEFFFNSLSAKSIACRDISLVNFGIKLNFMAGLIMQN